MRRLAELEAAAVVGRAVRVEPNGDVYVDYRDNPLGPVRARVAASETLKGAGEPVLLVFENGNPGLPIIAGVLREKARRSLAFEAAGAITITCGKSSITLSSDGRIVIKGTELVSRASGTNKIRGAAVKIN